MMNAEVVFNPLNLVTTKKNIIQLSLKACKYL